jgi:DNA-binding NarL/FixJ family response regulator
MLRAAKTASDPEDDSIARKRAMVADLCRLLGGQINRALPKPNDKPVNSSFPPLSPRMKQTLELLIGGASEKQIARRLSLSQHTVHVYVKALHKGFGVSSRGELLARFIDANSGLSQKSA